MQCPRCLEKLQNIVEYLQQDPDFMYIKDFYCTNCKSSLTERFDSRELFASEWIDFNV